MTEKIYQRFTKKNIIANIIIVALYLLWATILGGIRQDHVLLIILWLTTYYAHPNSRRFVVGFSIFIVYWIIYDSMRFMPNYEVATVHIKQPYELEKSLFGINFNGVLYTPSEFFALTHSKFLDILTGLFYINWVPIPLAFAVYLFVKDKTLFTQFSLVFLFVNIIGFVIYYIYPAAPPWYVALYGFDLKLGVGGNTAGLAHFDQLVGMPVFANIYNKNANVLAAIPSLHSSYPVVVLVYAIKKKLGAINIFFVIFMMGIWFSAVYSGHHYTIDVLAGILVALSGIFLCEQIFKTQLSKRLIQSFVSEIDSK